MTQVAGVTEKITISEVPDQETKVLERKGGPLDRMIEGQREILRGYIRNGATLESNKKKEIDALNAHYGQEIEGREKRARDYLDLVRTTEAELATLKQEKRVHLAEINGRYSADKEENRKVVAAIRKLIGDLERE